MTLNTFSRMKKADEEKLKADIENMIEGGF